MKKSNHLDDTILHKPTKTCIKWLDNVQLLCYSIQLLFILKKNNVKKQRR